MNKDMEIGLFYLKWSMFHLIGQKNKTDYLCNSCVFKDYHKLIMIRWKDIIS